MNKEGEELRRGALAWLTSQALRFSVLLFTLNRLPHAASLVATFARNAGCWLSGQPAWRRVTSGVNGYWQFLCTYVQSSRLLLALLPLLVAAPLPLVGRLLLLPSISLLPKLLLMSIVFLFGTSARIADVILLVSAMVLPDYLALPISLTSAALLALMELHRPEPESLLGRLRGSAQAVESLELVRLLWPAIPVSNVGRAGTSCPICLEDAEHLYGLAAGCKHGYCRSCCVRIVKGALQAGGFPLRCPQCATAGLMEGAMVTSSVLKGLHASGVVEETEALRVLLGQRRALQDEPSLDLILRTTKRCPNCGEATTRYRGHGCHHVTSSAGRGCRSCGHHWCFVCMASTGLNWFGCPNRCPLFCDDGCGCVTCPDCQPGRPCGHCSGNCPACVR